MSNQQNLSSPSVSSTTNQFKNVSDSIRTYLYHWPLFIIGLIITITLAFFYLSLTKPAYLVKAVIVIHDATKTPDQTGLTDIDLINSKKIVENEIEVIQSQHLIKKVVENLNLNVVTNEKKGMLTNDLYKSSPVKLTVINKTPEFDNAKINLVIIDTNNFYLAGDDGKWNKMHYNKLIASSFGLWKLEPTNELLNYKGQTIQITLRDPELLALEYQKSIDVSLLNKLGTAVIISISDAVPERGKDILNQLIYNYQLDIKTEHNQQTKLTLDFLDQRIDSLTGNLTTAEKGIEGFKSSRGITDISSESQFNLQNKQSNGSRLDEVNVQLSIIEGIEKYINSPKSQDKAPSTIGILDPALSNLIEKLAQLQLDRIQLLSTTPETNPDFDVINQQIAVTRADIKESVENIKSSLIDTRKQLQSNDSNIESSIKAIPTQERQYTSIKRQQSIKETLYNYLLQKREEVAVNYASTISNDQIVDQAYVEPLSRWRDTISYFIAAVLGLALPASLIFFRNGIKGKIKSLDDIKNTTTTPIIAEINFKGSSKASAIINNAQSNAVTEQFRTLLTKMYFLFDKKEYSRAILITSNVPNEGKSFVSANLAVASAYTGRKTILLQLDLRKPKTLEILKNPVTQAGISNYLQGEVLLSDIIQKSDVSHNLSIITSGTKNNNPIALFEKDQFLDLISHLKESYEDIIMDSPPARLVADALVLSKVSDISLYIVRQGVTDKTDLNFINKLHDQRQLKNMFLIFNGIQRNKYGYGYNFENSYYDIKGVEGHKSIFNNFLLRF